MKKAITPIVSVILLVLMTVGASALAFFWVSNVQTSVQESAGTAIDEAPGASCSRLNIISAKGDELVVSNVGCDTIESVNVLINGELTSYDLENPIGPGEAGLITFTEPLVSDTDYTFQVVLDTGTSTTVSVDSSEATSEGGFTGTGEGEETVNCEESGCTPNFVSFTGTILNTISDTTCACCGDDGQNDVFYNSSHYCSYGGVNNDFDALLHEDYEADLLNFSSGKGVCELAGHVWFTGNATADYGSEVVVGDTEGYGAPTVILAGDLDGDGWNDILTISNDEVIKVWKNGQHPDLTSWTGNKVGSNAANTFRGARLGDLDLDGDLDLIAADDYLGDTVYGNITLWENDGTPFTGEWTNYTINRSGNNMQDIIVSDLDNDKDLDIIKLISSGGISGIYVLENDGTPFNNEWGTNYVGTNDTDIVAVADMDSDGDVDIITLGDFHNEYLVWWENDGTPFTDEWSNHYIAEPDAGKSLAVGDLDNDNDNDIVIWASDDTWGVLYLYKNNGVGNEWTYSPPTADFLDSNYAMQNALTLADLNNDNLLDIIIAEGDLITYVNNGTISAYWEEKRVYDFTNTIYEFELAELEMDGDFDLIGNGADDDLIVRDFQSLEGVSSTIKGPCCGDDSSVNEVFSNETHCCQNGVFQTGTCT